jgi:hypothetical protein
MKYLWCENLLFWSLERVSCTERRVWMLYQPEIFPSERSYGSREPSTECGHCISVVQGPAQPTTSTVAQKRRYHFIDHVHPAYNPSFSVCFFSWNSIFLSQHISQQYFSAGLSAQPNGAIGWQVFAIQFLLKVLFYFLFLFLFFLQKKFLLFFSCLFLLFFYFFIFYCLLFFYSFSLYFYLSFISFYFRLCSSAL